MSADHDTPERVMVLAVPACATDDGGHAAAVLWADVLAAVQQVVPGAATLRPGWCAMRARGPVRYYGSELLAAQAVLERLLQAPEMVTRIRACAERTTSAEHSPDEKVPLAKIGVASGRFAAEQAVWARQSAAALFPHPEVCIVAAHDTARFLEPLPVECAAGEELSTVLIGLGVRTLGALAALPEQAVLQRFGREGVAAHRNSRGLIQLHTNEVPQQSPVRDLRINVSFDPPLDDSAHLAFACKQHAEAFVQGLASQGLVCTELLVELVDDIGVRHERLWSHPANFTTADVVSRVRLQASSLPQAAVQDTDRGGAGVTELRLTPARTARASEHEPGLWSTAPDERVHHQLTRAQSLVGHEGVGTARIVGGRLSRDRQMLVPWGSAADHSDARPRDGPWPGRLAGALPPTVFASPPPVRLLGRAETEVSIDEDELLSEPPSFISTGAGHTRGVVAWSRPWPLREQWHRPDARTLYRMQVLLDDGEAWVLQFDVSDGWRAEGRYD